MLGNFSQFFRIWGAFWTHLTPSLFFGTLDLDFYRFLVDFGWISEGFGDGFSMAFRIFAKNRDFVKIVAFLQKIAIFKDSSSQKSIKNPSKIHANFVWEQKIKHNAQEMDLGRS